MQFPDKVSIAVLLLLWFLLDVAVVTVDKSDGQALEYLTNQVWVTAIVAKAALVVELYRNHESEDYEAVSSSGWFATALFLIVGAAQAGVLGGFFMLTWLDSSLLDEMLSSGEHTIAEFAVFCRHVTVCFLHLAILWSLRHYLSLNAHGVHTFSLCVVDFTTDYTRFFWVVLLTPIIGGVVHSLFFDDEKLYKFGDSSVGSKSQLAFGAFSAIATFYYLNVPLRAVELEQNKPETVAKAILRVVVKDSPNGFSPNTSEQRK